nr:hypothetical protein [Tanacetum cinerariifolium]
MQKKKNDVKARTTLLLSLPDEHQLRFSKHKTAKELWAAILKKFGGNEATKKTKKNLLKQQYGNFRGEGSETLEQTFTRLQVIVVWRNMSDLDTMSLDDLYNHLKVYEAEVQKKSEPNTQNMAFISSTKHCRGNDEVNTASSNVPTASANVATVSISQETACAYISSQSGGMRADKFWKKISIQGSDVAGFDKSKVECFNCHKMGHFARECRAPRNQERGRRDTYRQGSKAEEQTPKALIAIDGVGWDWSYMANDEEDHALVAEALTEFALMANTSTENKVFDNSLCSKDCKKNNDCLNKSRLVEYKEREVKYIEKIRTFKFYDKGKMECIETLKKDLETLKQEKESVDGKLAGLLSASKNLDNLIKSQRPDKSKEGLGYTAVPRPVAQLYLSPKKYLSWTGLPECADDTVTDYSRPSPTVESSSEEDQNRNPYAYENVASPITPKQFVKFVKACDSQSKNKTDEKETPEKPPFKNAEQYGKPNKKPNVRGNQRNWNNSKSLQLCPDFVMIKKTCFNCGDFNHLAYECRKRGSFQNRIDDKGYWDSGCSRHMTGNISYLSDYEPFDGGYVSFGQGGCKITRKGTIKTGKLEFENVYFVKYLKLKNTNRAPSYTLSRGSTIIPYSYFLIIHSHCYTIPTITQSEPTPLRQYTRRVRIAQSSALLPVADEPMYLVRDVSEGEACPTDSGFIADQDKATIAKSSTLPHDTAPRVTSPAIVEGSMQQTINELTALCTSLQRQHSELLIQFQAQKVEINKLNARVKILEDNQGVIGTRSTDDAPIKGRRIYEEEGITGRVSSDTEEIRMDQGEVVVERTSDDTEEMATVLTSMDAATVLAGGINVPNGSDSIPTAGPPVVDIHTGSDAVPTASPIVATATVVTPYSRRKGKEVMVEFDTPKKQRLQNQIDAQVARELEEQQEREDKRMIEQIAKDAKDNYSKIYKFQSQHRRPWTKKQKDYYITVIKNNLGWKVKDFKGITFKEIKAKFVAVWKLVEDFIPMGSKEEAERLKRKGFNLEQEKAKKQKTSEEVPDKEKSPGEILKEKVKEMMQLVPIEEVYVQALQVKHPIID